jgi:hypothetical protein
VRVPRRSGRIPRMLARVAGLLLRVVRELLPVAQVLLCVAKGSQRAPRRLLPATRSSGLELRSPAPLAKSSQPGHSVPSSTAHSSLSSCLTALPISLTAASIGRVALSLALDSPPISLRRLSREREAVSSSHDAVSTDKVRAAKARATACVVPLPLSLRYASQRDDRPRTASLSLSSPPLRLSRSTVS